MKRYIFFLATTLLMTGSYAQDYNISEADDFFDGEPYLSINPDDPQHIVACWMGVEGFRIYINTRVSFDGGNSWSPEVIIGNEGLGRDHADPSLAWDGAGNLYLCYIDFFTTAQIGGVFVRKSTDGGLTWGASSQVLLDDDDGPFDKIIDRPWMVVDRSGTATDGNIYITTMNAKTALTPPYNPYLSRSYDEGVTWEPWRYIDTVGWYAGSAIPQPMPFPAVTGDGILYAVYPSYVDTQHWAPQIILAKSGDGGDSFSHSQVFWTLNIISDTLIKKGSPMISDPSDDDHLAYFYLSNPEGDADVYMRETFDGGSSWSAEQRINDDPIANNRMQDLVWANFDNDGDLMVCWRDRRNASDSTYTVNTEIWGAHRPTGGSFEPNFQVSATFAAHDTIVEASGNDFLCVELVDDTASVIWGDARDGTLRIWFKRILSDGTTVSIKDLNQEKTNITVYPNPTADIVNIDGVIPARVEIYNMNGERLLEDLTSKTSIDVSGLTPGVYLMKITDQNGLIMTSDFVVKR